MVRPALSVLKAVLGFVPFYDLSVDFVRVWFALDRWDLETSFWSTWPDFFLAANDPIGGFVDTFLVVYGMQYEFFDLWVGREDLTFIVLFRLAYPLLAPVDKLTVSRFFGIFCES